LFLHNLAGIYVCYLTDFNMTNNNVAWLNDIG
jgi:hypothetical protein